MSENEFAETAKRGSFPNAVPRGRPQRPHPVSAGSAEPGRETTRVLALKIEIDWKDEASKALYNRLRDLGWMAAHYRNQQSHAKWAELRGWRVVTNLEDKSGVSKEIRHTEKRELSGDAYCVAEREVGAAWTRDFDRIMAGSPVPQWRPGAALSVTGKARMKDSGVYLSEKGGRYTLHLRAQSEKCPEGSWLLLPVSKRTSRDEWQVPILNRMLDWSTPIQKALIVVKRTKIIARLCYPLQLPALPAFGNRVAVLGPARMDEQEVLRLHLRTETQSKDYSSKLNYLCRIKDDWDKIRRRATSQIGWRHGHARAKRILIARFRLPDKQTSFLHQWSHEMVEWCRTQGVGTLRAVGIGTGDWPADRLKQMLQYKSEQCGIKFETDSDLKSESAGRAARAVVSKRGRQIKKRAEAVRTLRHNLEKEK